MLEEEQTWAPAPVTVEFAAHPKAAVHCSHLLEHSDFLPGVLAVGASFSEQKQSLILRSIFFNIKKADIN